MGVNLKKFAVIGSDVSHSLSPDIHRFIAERSGDKIEYGAISLTAEEFEKNIGDILKNYDGLNITIPYKLSVMPRLEKIRGDAAVFGAVNTVDCKTLTGYNTDGDGFMLMLENAGISVRGKKVLVLGAGGAGRSAVKKLIDENAEVSVYNRTYVKARTLSEEFGAKPLAELKKEKYYMIVNATGVGMNSTVGESPVGEEIISGCDIAVDLIYEPEKSRFLQIAEECGKKTVNGLSMLFYQAYFAQRLFFGRRADGCQANRLYDEWRKL